MTTITEIAPEIYRLSTYVPEADIQYGQFLVRDEEPLLFHTGPRGMFPVVHDAVVTLIDPTELRWVGFSHLESDECGSLNQWLELAPRATPLCSRVGAVVSIDDIAIRPARPMDQDDVLTTGRLRFRFQQTPNVPHAWDAGLLFEETGRTLLCSDLFHQNGDVEALTEQDVVGRTRQMFLDYESNFLAGYQPYTPRTEPTLHRLAALEPAVLATMHGSVYTGDGAQALRDLAGMMRETLGGE
jgi:flavorubredoxin